MARETRSQTGNSKPRVVPVIDTAPTIKRKAAAAKPKTETKGAKPTGVTKKKAPAKESGAAKKVRIPSRPLYASLILTGCMIGQGCGEEDGEEGGRD
jgi:hypothetical protein